MTKVSLYTITYSGMYYVGPHVPLTEQIPKAKAMGFDGIEICGKRPFGFPPDLDADARRTIRELAAAEGVEISAVASYNNFASPIMEEYENELLMVLPDTSAMTAEVKVNESLTGLIEPGQRAIITSDAMPDVALEGEVIEIGTDFIEAAEAGPGDWDGEAP